MNRILVAMLGLFSLPGIAAAADLKVGGTISPSSCSVTMDSNKIELAGLRAKMFLKGEDLGVSFVYLTVDCTTATRYALSFTDEGRTATIKSDDDFVLTGTIGTETFQVGGYAITNSDADLVQVGGAFDDTDIVPNSGSVHLGWASAPLARRGDRARLEIGPYLSELDLDVNQDMQIAGAFAVELMYL